MATITITEEEKKRAQDAYEAFNEYATVKADADISAFTELQQLQIQHHRWQANALPVDADSSLTVMTLGLVEEACWELVQAVEDGDRDEQYDTLGDILTYACSSCTNLRLDLHTLARGFDPTLIEQPEQDGLLVMFKAVGMLAHVVGKQRQRTRGYDEIAKVREHAGASLARLFAAVHWLAFANDWEVTLLFKDVLTRVMRRNWKLNSNDGDVSAQAALPLAPQS